MPGPALTAAVGGDENKDPRIALLTWLAEHPKADPAVLVDLLRLGARDLTALAESVGTGRAVAENVRMLVQAGWVAVDDEHLIEAVAVIGARIVLDDPDNACEWTAVAHRFQQITVPEGAYRLRNWCRGTTASQVVAGFYDAGRSPAYAQAMLQRAEAAALPADTFGYGDQIRPETFTALVEAGVTTGPEYLSLTTGDEPMTAVEVIQWTSQGIDPTVLAAARESSLPRHQWATLLPGMPGHWFQRGDDGRLVPGRSMRSLGYTWNDLAILVEREWTGLGYHRAEYGLRLSNSRGADTDPVHPRTALRASEVGPYDVVVRWATALSAGTYRGRGNGLPPLIPKPRRVLDHVDDMRALIDAGIAPSHLAAYRAAGCRTVEDVLTAAAAGITGPRARHLQEVHGKSTYYAHKRIASIGDLLAAHAEEPR